MAIVHYFLAEDAELSPEEIEELDKLAQMKDEEIIYDEDCPPLTEEELARFKPVENPKEGIIKLIIET